MWGRDNARGVRCCAVLLFNNKSRIMFVLLQVLHRTKHAHLDGTAAAGYAEVALATRAPGVPTPSMTHARTQKKPKARVPLNGRFSRI